MWSCVRRDWNVRDLIWLGKRWREKISIGLQEQDTVVIYSVCRVKFSMAYCQDHTHTNTSAFNTTSQCLNVHFSSHPSVNVVCLRVCLCVCQDTLSSSFHVEQGHLKSSGWLWISENDSAPLVRQRITVLPELCGLNKYGFFLAAVKQQLFWTYPLK